MEFFAKSCLSIQHLHFLFLIVTKRFLFFKKSNNIFKPGGLDRWPFDNFLTVKTDILKLLRFSWLLTPTFWNFWEFLNCRDLHFETVENFLTVKTYILKLLWISWLSRCPCWNCRDWDDIENWEFMALVMSKLVQMWFLKLTSFSLCWDLLFEAVKNCLTVETNRDPQV